jgi:hypothetical protein
MEELLQFYPDPHRRLDTQNAILDLSDASDFELKLLLKIILEEVHRIAFIHHVEVDGRKYFGHPNQRYDPPSDAEYDSDDFDSESDEENEEGEELGIETAEKYGRTGIKYVLSYGDEGFDIIHSLNEYIGRSDITQVIALENSKTLSSYLASLDSNIATFQVRVSGPLDFTNPTGFNPDNRGADSTTITLDFQREWTVTPDALGIVTFAQLAEACLRLNSHKFDRNYELYTHAGVERDKNGLTKIALEYDHGS